MENCLMGSWLTSAEFSGAGPARGRSHMLTPGTSAGGTLGDEYSERTFPAGKLRGVHRRRR
eukprot:10386556-Alexandrium_andersonii.AAC.1